MKSLGFLKNRLGIAILLIGVIVLCVGVYAAYPRLVSTNVSGIKADPDSYKGKKVYIFGTITDRFSYGDYSGIKVSDGTGEIYAVWGGTLYATGTKVLVRGIVKVESWGMLGSTVYIQSTSVDVWHL